MSIYKCKHNVNKNWLLIDALSIKGSGKGAGSRKLLPTSGDKEGMGGGKHLLVSTSMNWKLRILYQLEMHDFKSKDARLIRDIPCQKGQETWNNLKL